MLFDIQSALKELAQKKRELENVNKVRDFLMASISHLEGICKPFAETTPVSPIPLENLKGGQDLAKHLIDIFVQHDNKPMPTPEIINSLENLPIPIKTTASRITGAVHNSKDRFEPLEGKRGVYKLKDDFYLTLTQKDKDSPIS